MKSVFLSILIFIGVFLFAKSDILEVAGEKWFDYLSYGVLTVVIICGLYASIVYKPRRLSANKDDSLKKADIGKGLKEENDDTE